eukprot:gnl/Hemi2/13294_TR4561_c0_g1_i2.p1 gnl/Hemi2/13294_TR4561_c0_g1~~gnl/Hemi2/13294_TR4561_c0_g1_i2.p1  ORF type:complete len:199 (-),score=28.01 gnl/Hemi2/13294_TR4561_c0_g1_i2:104-700(-)
MLPRMQSRIRFSSSSCLVSALPGLFLWPQTTRRCRNAVYSCRAVRKIGEYKPKPSDKNAGSFARFAIFFFESLSDFEACNNRLILYHSLATPDASDDVFLQHPNMEIVPSKCRIGKADVIRMRIWGIPARSRNDRLQAMFKFVGIPSLHSAVLPTTKDQACSAFFWVPGAAKDTTLQFSGKLMLNNRPLRIYPAQFYQ